MIWIGIVIGMFIGATIGTFIVAMCVSAKHGDEMMSPVKEVKVDVHDHS